MDSTKKLMTAVIVTGLLLVAEGWIAFAFFVAIISDMGSGMERPFEAVVALTIAVTAFCGIFAVLVWVDAE